MPATYEPIATNTLGSAQASITFSSIPATYTDLRVVLVANPVTADGLAFQINGLTTSIYSGTWLAGSGGGAFGTNVINQGYGYWNMYGSASSTIPNLNTIDFFNYTGSTNKTALATTSNDKSGSGSSERSVQLIRTTAAITSIRLFSQASYNLSAGSVATLYGIKAA